MTDLHTHILPGMDDGPKDLASALALLEAQARQGVTQVALTSHYHCETEALSSFLDRREAAFRQLAQAAPGDMKLKRGCEVFFSPELLSLEVEQLCLEGTNVLLLELPVMQRPAFLQEVFDGLDRRGIVPLIAHVERYAYVERDPRLLADWMEQGAMIQVNAGSLAQSAFARKLVKWGLVHVAASDTHSVRHRPPNLRQGLDALPREQAKVLARNAGLLFRGKTVPTGEVHVPKKVLGIWM